MALATDTTPGEIVLAGDFKGSNDGHAPELTPTGVIPGSHLIGEVVVDDKGRVLYIEDMVSSHIEGLATDATNSSKGIVQVDDSGYLSISSGVLSITIPDATNSSKGIVQVDDSGYLSISSGEVSISIPDTTGSSKGVIQVDDSGLLDISSGVLSIDSPSDATDSAKGLMQVTDTNGLDLTSGVLSFELDATNSSKGLVEVDDSGALGISSGVLSFTAPSNIAQYAQVGQYTKQQHNAIQTVTTDSFTPGLLEGNLFKWTATGSTLTLNAPTNFYPGTTFTIIVEGEKTINFDSSYQIHSTPSNLVGSLNVVTVICDNITSPQRFLTYIEHDFVV